MPVTGPDFISLQARDLAASQAFYEQYLGLVRSPAGPPHAVVFDTAPVAFAQGSGPQSYGYVTQVLPHGDHLILSSLHGDTLARVPLSRVRS